MVFSEHWFVTSEVPMGFPELRIFVRIHKNEIYNLGVAPDLQISKKVDLLMIYIFFLHLLKNDLTENLKGNLKGNFTREFKVTFKRIFQGMF